YTYLRSRDTRIRAFSTRLQDAHLAASADILANERDLKARLLGVMRAMIRITEPYHRFAGVLFRTAADPNSPLNPFSHESEQARQQSIALFTRVVEGSGARIPADLKQELPYLLWLYHMGITLFWIHDSSPRTRRTYRLIDRTVDIVVKLIGLASNPLMRPLRKAALGLVAELRDSDS